ncbi:MAG: FecR domain-containing protein [Proteobacteria bacterium]|nr:FecR domain-containing protein [Pseudomonadota bacterium]
MIGKRCVTVFLLALLAVIFANDILAQQSDTETPDYIYRTRAGDTLIGFARRALIEPGRWQDLQRLNGIANPRRLPIGTPLRVPVAWLKQTVVDAEVIDIIGTVAVGGRALRVGDRLAEGDELDTGATGFVSLRTGEGAVIVLQSGSRVVLQRLRRYDGAAAHDTRVELESGRAESDVPTGNAGRFEIVTPVAIGAVRGTEFRVAFDQQDRSARNEVVRGEVAVAGLGGGATAETAIAAGFGARTDSSGRTAPPVKLLPAPQLAGPAASFDSPTARFSLRPLAGAAAYRAQVAIDASLRQTVVEQLIEANESAPAVTITGLDDGEYWLRVRGVDASGLQGVETVHRFELRAQPLPPTLLQPDPAGKQSATATFRWRAAASGPHRLEVARDAEFAQVVIERRALAGEELTLESLAAGEYVWRMAAERPDSTSGPWSESRVFTQKALPAPPEPIELRDRTVAVSWQADSGQQFRVQLARSAEFKTLLHDEQLTEPRWQFSSPGPGSYFVRVQHTDADGYVGPWSAPTAFEVPAPRWIRWLTVVSFLPLLL